MLFDTPRPPSNLVWDQFVIRQTEKYFGIDFGRVNLPYDNLYGYAKSQNAVRKAIQRNSKGKTRVKYVLEDIGCSDVELVWNLLIFFIPSDQSALEGVVSAAEHALDSRKIRRGAYLCCMGPHVQGYFAKELITPANDSDKTDKLWKYISEYRGVLAQKLSK